MHQQIETGDFNQDIPAFDGDPLVMEADQFAAQYNVPPEITEPTYELLHKLEEFDHQTAVESVQALPLALTAGEVMADFYPGAAVNFPGIWAAELLHDVGKIEVGHELIDKSNEGQAWDPDDVEKMKHHPEAGGAMVRGAGLPEIVARPVEEHHHKQISSATYGPNAELTNEERIVRDCVAVADFADAMLTRTNTRNRDMSAEERQRAIREDIGLVVDDYSDADRLADAIYQRFMSQLGLAA